MTGWNLPPGCNVSDIPGNRPEDELWEREAIIFCGECERKEICNDDIGCCPRTCEFEQKFEAMMEDREKGMDDRFYEDYRDRMLEKEE